TTFLGKRNYGRLQLTAQLHNKMAPPTDMPRLPVLSSVSVFRPILDSLISLNFMNDTKPK
ncbi:hypothetical protein, partial [Brucella anthropi]|uniref:hypothetical protein n=1 Tax=Brucella anthropi TaxID=529 RepID=UPI003850A9DF